MTRPTHNMLIDIHHFGSSYGRDDRKLLGCQRVGRFLHDLQVLHVNFKNAASQARRIEVFAGEGGLQLLGAFRHIPWL